MTTPGYANLRDFGAYGDRSHDDTPALLAARDHLRETGGGLLEVPPGQYLVCDPVMGGPNNFSYSIRGYGREVSRFVLGTDTGYGFSFGDGVDQLRGCRVSDLSFEYPQPPSGGYGLRFRKLNGFVLSNIWLVTFTNGIEVGDPGDTDGDVMHLTLEHVKADPGPLPGVVMDVRAANGLTFVNTDLSGRHGGTGLRFNNPRIVDTVTIHGLLIKDAGTGIRAGHGQVSNVIGCGLRIDANTTAGLHLETAAGVYLSSWQISPGWINTSGYGVILDAQATGSRIDNIRLDNLSIDGTAHTRFAVAGAVTNVSLNNGPLV